MTFTIKWNLCFNTHNDKRRSTTSHCYMSMHFIDNNGVVISIGRHDYAEPIISYEAAQTTLRHSTFESNLNSTKLIRTNDFPNPISFSISYCAGEFEISSVIEADGSRLQSN